MKRIILTLLLSSALVSHAWYAASGRKQVKLSKDTGRLLPGETFSHRIVYNGKRYLVVKGSPDDGFEVAPNQKYRVTLYTQTSRSDNAYMNFYLQGYRADGKESKIYAGLGSGPGKKAIGRGRMSRLEIISDHFIKHEVRFTVGKDTVKVVPVFEFSDGAVEMNFGGISVVPDVPETTGVILSKPVKYGVAFVNDPAVKTLWSSFDLLPQVSYHMEFTADGALPYAKLVFRDSGRKVLTVLPMPIVKGGNKTVCQVPPTAVYAALETAATERTVAVSEVKLTKNIAVLSHRGVLDNEWQGFELGRGSATDSVVCYRRTFELSSPVVHGAVRFMGHNHALLYVNGKLCGKGSQFAPGVADITPYLRPGKNVIALACYSSSGTLRVVFDAFIKERSGKWQFICSDDRTRYAGNQKGLAWTEAGFDDAAWEKAPAINSPLDFGSSIIAARINDYAPDLYIGERKELTLSRVKLPKRSAADLPLEISFDLTGRGKFDYLTGSVTFASGEKQWSLPVTAERNADGRVSLQVTPYVPAGEYKVQISFHRGRFAGGLSQELGSITVTPRQKELPRFEVRKHADKAVIFRDGKPMESQIFCYRRYSGSEFDILKRTTGIKIHMIKVGGEVHQPTPDGRNGYDFTEAEKMIYDAVARLNDDPESFIIVAFPFNPPVIFEQDPALEDHLTRTSKGEKLRLDVRKPKGAYKFGRPYTDIKKVTGKGFSSVSHASDKKGEIYENFMRAVVKHFENTPYAGKIIGYSITGEMDEQWHLFAPYSGAGVKVGMADYSPVMVKYFRNFLREKYQTVANLRRVWGNQTVTFENAAIPGYRERAGENFFVSAAAADYSQAYSKAIADLIDRLAKAAKEQSGFRALTFVYPVDSYRDVGINQFLPQTLNSAAGWRQYAGKYIDMLGNPTDYYYRRNGLPTANRGCQASATLNNTVKLVEADLRSYLTEPHQNVWGGRNSFASQSHIKKNGMESFKGGGSLRYYTFYKGWYNNAGVQQSIGMLTDIHRKQLNQPLRWKPQVCLLYDTAAISHVGNFDTRKNGSRNYAHMKSLTAAAAHVLNRSGVGVDIYYLQDLAHKDFPAGQYKIYIFCGVFQVTPEIDALINTKLRRNGNLLIFPWGNGFLNSAHQVDPQAVEQLTGIKVKADYPSATVREINIVPGAVAPALDNAKIGSRDRYNMTAELPVFVSADKQAKVLGRFADGGAALVRKNFGHYETVLGAVGNLTPALVREFCRSKGVHVYVDNDYDFVATEGNYLSVHSGAGGKKQVLLPEKIAGLRNVESGEVLPVNGKVAIIPLVDDETAVFEIIR